MKLVDVLRAAGWPESELGNALGIISHEDPSGDPTTPSGYNALGTEDSWGLFQINRKAHTQYSVAQLQDALTNATIARQLWQSRGNYQDWVYSAQALSISPYGSARHTIGEFDWLANKDMPTGAGTPPASPSGAVGPFVANHKSVVAAVGILALFLILAGEI